MGKKVLIAAFAAICIISCSTEDSDIQTITIDKNIPEIADLITFIPDSQYDDTSIGKYVGIFGHHLNQELHGKIYVNAGLDTRYTALIQLVNGEELKFKGVQQSRSKDIVYFEGESGAFDIDFTDHRSPEVTNVMMDSSDTEAYIILAKTTRGVDPLVIVGSYVDSTDPTFFGNWDLMANPSTNTATPVSFMGINGTAITQEIITMSISHAGSMIPFISNTAEDFDTNIAVACAPPGVVIPTTEPVIIDLIVPFVGNVGGGISAGGQTSMINGIEAAWSFNYTSAIPIAGLPEMYVANDCSPTLSGTWSWNGRTGTTTAL
ncbi:hypothetical protein [uncultured Dokdonia sp.]|uniref:hypothetical protein n=1 Tax=uncultured Dokdonia sp. TaxID=575653 RepID=UPI0026083373|nr:hypothetical protein [uncultured Dokdonia sp.]